MASKAHQRLIVDSDIMQAAGGRSDAPHPSLACRAFLDELRTLKHSVVRTPAIAAEWERHASKYARRWLEAMDKAGHVLRLELAESPSLRASVAATAENEGARAAMLKDCHLLEAALASERRVCSMDERARGLLRRAARDVDGIQQIVWVNPSFTADGVIVWLRRGAPAEKRRMLGYRGEED